jgi:DNA modification methylase
MAKKRLNPNQRTFESLRSAPKLPHGYYSGDKPNPNLRAFVEAHLRERPYDPETDDYDVRAFNRPIETTKATAIYNMHVYWSKKPQTAIRQYVEHHTKPGDIVLDPFYGSGGTALAALLDGRKAIAIDRSPAATFITKNHCRFTRPVAIKVQPRQLSQSWEPYLEYLVVQINRT